MKQRNVCLLITIIVLMATHIYSQEVKGKFINTENGLIDYLEIIDDLICRLNYCGINISATYKLEKNHIILTDQKGSLIFTIKDSETLVGEGYTSGIYKKEINNNYQNELKGNWIGQLKHKKVKIVFNENLNYRIEYFEDNTKESGKYFCNDNIVELESGNDYYFLVNDKILFLDTVYDFDNENVDVSTIDGVFIQE